MDLMLKVLVEKIEWKDEGDRQTGLLHIAIIGDFKLVIENIGGVLYSMSHDSYLWKIIHLIGENRVERIIESSDKYYDVLEDAKHLCVYQLNEIGKTFYGRPIDWNNYPASEAGSTDTELKDGEMIVTQRPEIQIKIKNNMGEANEKLPVLFVIFKHPEHDRWHAKIVCKNNIGFAIWDSRWVYQKPGNYLNMQTAKEAIMICGEVYLTLIQQS